MTNKGYMAFMPDWREHKKELTPEQWYELEDYMFMLRFDNIDTDPSTIEDKEIRIIWRSVRTSLLKIIRNYNYKKKSKGKKDIESNEEFDTPQEENNNATMQDWITLRNKTLKAFVTAFEEKLNVSIKQNYKNYKLLKSHMLQIIFS